MVHYGNNDFMKDYLSKPRLSFLTLDNGIQNFSPSTFFHSLCCSTFTTEIHPSISPNSPGFLHLFFLPPIYSSKGPSNLILGYFLVFRLLQTDSKFFCWGKIIVVHFTPSPDHHTTQTSNLIIEFSFLR